MKRVVGAGMMMVAITASSGCAGMRTSQELKRLQSQVGLLDERVAQLEHGSAGWQAAEPMPEPAAQALMTSPAAPKKAEGSAKSAAVSSIKPTTREIQESLKNAGFYQGAVDGKMGPATREAVKEFQRVHGLTDDGVVGKKTWAKLSAYATLSSGESSAAEILK